MDLLILILICMSLFIFGIGFSIVRGHTFNSTETKIKNKVVEKLTCFDGAAKHIDNVSAHNIVTAIGGAIVEESNKLERFNKIDAQLKLSEQYYRHSSNEVVKLEERRPTLTIVKIKTGR